jgi:hypothetical protein
MEHGAGKRHSPGFPVEIRGYATRLSVFAWLMPALFVLPARSPAHGEGRQTAFPAALAQSNL